MNRLYDDLIAYGYRVRKYDLDMVDNRPIQSALLAIRDAGYFVAILTPTSVESTFLREYSSLLQELETDQTLVVPLLYESCAIPEVLSPKPYIDFTESYGRGLDQLRKTLHETKLLPSSIVTISASGARLADTTAKLTAALTGSQNLYLAVDVGGTKAYIALMTSDGERLFNRKYSTRSYRDETALLEFMVWSIKDTISGIHNASRRPTVDVEEKISAIGIAFAGPTDSANGIVRAAPNLDIKTDFPLATALSQALEGKPVYVGNDADLGVLGETWKGAARSYKNIIGIIIGTGIGGGIVVDGQLYGGATSAAGEIGHMVVDLDSKYQCGCKQYGCFEVLASRQAMARELHRRKAMKSMNDMRWQENNLGSNELAHYVRTKDPDALAVVSKAAEICGKAVFSLLNIFNPDLIFFGGGFILQLGEEFLDRVKAEARKCMNSIYESDGRTVPIVIGTLDNPMLTGACFLASRGHMVQTTRSLLVETIMDGLNEHDFEVLRSLCNDPGLIAGDSINDFYKKKLRTLRDRGLIRTDNGQSLSHASQVEITRLGRIIVDGIDW